MEFPKVIRRFPKTPYSVYVRGTTRGVKLGFWGGGFTVSVIYGCGFSMLASGKSCFGLRCHDFSGACRMKVLGGLGLNPKPETLNLKP